MATRLRAGALYHSHSCQPAKSRDRSVKKWDLWVKSRDISIEILKSLEGQPLKKWDCPSEIGTVGNYEEKKQTKNIASVAMENNAAQLIIILRMHNQRGAGLGICMPLDYKLDHGWSGARV